MLKRSYNLLSELAKDFYYVDLFEKNTEKIITELILPVFEPTMNEIDEFIFSDNPREFFNYYRDLFEEKIG